MKIPRPVTIDFESERIEPRPNYPPRPAGLTVKYPGRSPRYYAWGHPEENNCTIATAKIALKEAYLHSDGVLMQNAKFDLAVAERWFSLKPPPWHKIHDTLFLLFLYDPYAESLSLKPSAERILNMPPEERDLLREWILINVPEARRKPSEWGAWISKGPGKLVGQYSNGDAVRTEKLFQFLWKNIAERGMLGAYDRERQLLPILLKNEAEGVRVDLPGLEQDAVSYQRAMEIADNWLRKRLKAPSMNIDSDREMAEALARAKVVTSWHYTAPTARFPQGQRSTSKANLTLPMFNCKKTAAVFGYRNRLATCLSTFLLPWLTMARECRGRVHTEWNQVRGEKDGGARTGRFSSSPNFQNIPKVFGMKRDAEFGPYLGMLTKFLPELPALPQMRRYFLPDKDEVWLRRDYNGQELRVLAHFEDGALLQNYLANPYYDLHEEIRQGVAAIVGITLDREVIKNGIVFPDIYGSGVPGMMATMERYGLSMTIAQCKAIRAAKKKLMPDVTALEEEIRETGKAGGCVRTWGGREYYTEAPKFSSKYGRMMTWEYKLLNYIVQGSSADCTKAAMINYAEHPKRRGRLLLTVHDEIDSTAPRKLWQQEMKVLQEAMEIVPLDLKMLSDGEYGENWGSLTKEKR